MSPDNIATAIRDIAESMIAVEDGNAGVKHGREALIRLAARVEAGKNDVGSRETYSHAASADTVADAARSMAQAALDELTPDRRVRGR